MDIFVLGGRDFSAGLDFLFEKANALNTPFICANVQDAQSGSRPFKGHAILDAGGLKVGILGLASQDVAKRLPSDIGIAITDPISAAMEALADLSGKADLVLAVANLTEAETSRLTSELKGIDFIINGHWIQRLPNRPEQSNGVPVLHSYTRGKYVGVLNVQMFGDDRRFVDASERAALEKQLENLQRQIDAYQAAERDVRKQRIYGKLTEKRDEVRRKLDKHKEVRSSFTFETVPLDIEVPDDPAVKDLVDSYNRAYTLARGMAESLP